MDKPGQITAQVSVVIATLKRPLQLAKALESLAKQAPSTGTFEVIVADNGCSTETEAITEQYRKSFSRLVYLRVPKPGAAAARNAGVAASSAPILLFLDDDIVADPELVSAHIEAHRSAEDIAVLGPVRFPWNGKESVFTYTLINHPELLQSFELADHEKVSYLYFYTCNLSMKRSSFKKAGAFDESFTASGFEDIDLGYRFESSGGRLTLFQRASALHNVQTSYAAFSRKCFRDGWWLGHMLQKHPELRSKLEPPRRGIRSFAKKALGMCGAILPSVFDWPLAPLTGWIRAPLAALCWHALGTSYRKGYEGYLVDSKKGQPIATKNAANAEACGDV